MPSPSPQQSASGLNVPAPEKPFGAGTGPEDAPQLRFETAFCLIVAPQYHARPPGVRRVEGVGRFGLLFQDGTRLNARGDIGLFGGLFGRLRRRGRNGDQKKDDEDHAHAGLPCVQFRL